MGAVLVTCAAVLAVGPAVAGAAVPGATRLDDRILDPAARGNVTYAGTANVGSYQQDGLLTHGDYQYVAWYRADRTAVISRRHLPDGAWKSIELDGVLFADDSHNNIAMGFSADGRLHVALPTHVNLMRYTRSVPGLGSGDAAWSSRSFEPVKQQLPGAPGAAVWWTYPQFERDGDRLLLTWRDGTSIEGRQVLARYDDNAAGTWSYLGNFTAGRGTYTNRYGSSEARHSYLHGFNVNPVTGDIEVTWTWRENAPAACAPSGTPNHDLAYARSSDGGQTWVNNGGKVVGRTGSDDVITIADTTTVVPIGVERGMINQETQTFDAEGRLHVATTQLDDDGLTAIGGCVTDFYGQRTNAHPFHHWRDDAGIWHTTELPFTLDSAGRTKLIFDRDDNAVLVLPDGRIATATAAYSGRTGRSSSTPPTSTASARRSSTASACSATAC
jgi:hypothetical protein